RRFQCPSPNMCHQRQHGGVNVRVAGEELAEGLLGGIHTSDGPGVGSGGNGLPTSGHKASALPVFWRVRTTEDYVLSVQAVRTALVAATAMVATCAGGSVNP